MKFSQFLKESLDYDEVKKTITVNGIEYKINLLGYKDHYDVTKQWAVVLKGPKGSDILVYPAVYSYEEGYDQFQNSGKKYYLNTLGFGTASQGSGRSSPGKPYLSSRDIDHLEDNIKNNPKYTKILHTFKYGTKNQEIIDEIY